MPRRNYPATRRNLRRFAGQPENILVLPPTDVRANIEQDCMRELGLEGKCAAGELTWEDQMKIDLLADEVEKLETV